jgi:hypothetical protein
VDVWSVEYEPFEEYAVVEDFRDPEQFLKLVESKSLLHSFYPIATCILSTLYLFIALH